MTRFHLTGTDAGTGEEVDLWLDGGIFVEGPLTDAVQLRGYVLPGFVDAHCHIGYSTTGAVELTIAEEQARTNLEAGVLAIRDCGSPLDTRPLVGRKDLPILIRAGRHVARPKRYIRDLGVDIEPDRLVDEVRTQLEYGSGWIKIVGDWIDRDLGDLAPLWPLDVLTEAIAVAHAGEARVTTHVFGEQALAEMLQAGVDCIEHGTGLTDDTISVMAERGVHLVPTLINIENFPDFAAAATRFPTYARHMGELYSRSRDTFRQAADAGISMHAGTDAGGYVEHGRIVEEVQALSELGRDVPEVLRMSAHDARTWLGLPNYQLGEAADLLIYDTDPARDLEVLHSPAAVLRTGQVRAGRLASAGGIPLSVD
jgi:imidazolonepropionase-like amidohydrolase